MPSQAAIIVKTHMSRFTAKNQSPRQRVSSLRGVGKTLFSGAPQVFIDAYWALVDSGHRPKTIAIVSDEPHMPWELMRPHRLVSSEIVSEEALGVQCAVGRWVGKNGFAAPQSIPLESVQVVAPKYTTRELKRR